MTQYLTWTYLYEIQYCQAIKEIQIKKSIKNSFLSLRFFFIFWYAYLLKIDSFKIVAVCIEVSKWFLCTEDSQVLEVFFFTKVDSFILVFTLPVVRLVLTTNYYSKIKGFRRVKRDVTYDGWDNSVVMIQKFQNFNWNLRLGRKTS